MANSDESTGQCSKPSSRFPERLPFGRWLNIAFRTAHIGLTGVLCGGHVFEVPENQLLMWLYMAIVTGVCLIVLEAYPRVHWFHQGRGVMVLAKMALMCVIPFCWSYRVHILALIVVLASVGSHMPARFRYYSLLERRILDH